MSLAQYYKSLSSEMMALQNRVRELVADAHWLTDGEHKETVFRQALRRIAPRNLAVGRGFIVAPNSDYVSTQIDVLVYDDTYPVRYREGDLVIIPPAACRAVVEVKTKLTNRATFRRHAEKQVLLLRELRGAGAEQEVFSGLFYFECSLRTPGPGIGQALGRVNTNCTDGADERHCCTWKSAPSNSPLSNIVCPSNEATSA